MTTYKEIFGKPVKFLSTDPDNAEAEGQIWYNGTSGSFKSVTQVEAWSSGSPLITARNSLRGAGTQTSAVVFGGFEPGNSNKTEEYNGSGWSTGGNLGTARYALASATNGTQTAALAFGGQTTPPATSQSATEEYNGTAWTGGGNLNTARGYLAGAGTQTTGLGFGGLVSGGTASQNVTEEYDGTSWTAGNNLNTGRNNISGCGLQTAALGFGGYAPPGTAGLTATEEYDGTSWTAGGNLNTGRRGMGEAGTQTAALGFGGYSPASTNVTSTESYDGSAWTNSPASLGTAVRRSAGAGTNSAALSTGGFGPSFTAATEEYNQSASVITAAAWSSGATQPIGRQDIASFGTSRSAGIMFAGGSGSPGNLTSALTYDGTWSSNPSLNTARTLTQGFGTLGAGNVAGGFDGSEISATENWNGSTWTTTGSLNNAKRNSTAFGTQTAGVVAGSSPSAPPAEAVEHFDGTSWTAATALPTPTTATYSRGCGIQTAGLWVRSANTYEYNGSAWTASNSLNTSRFAGSMAGIQTSALYGTGYGNTVATEAYDGTSWRTDANAGIPAVRNSSGPAGNSSSLVRAGGENTPSGNYLTSVEDYNPETSALNFKTLTTS